MTSSFEDVKKFLVQSADKCVDFFPVANSNSKIVDHLGTMYQPYLQVLGRLHSDTLIAVWNDEPATKNWQQQPVVWIDSEGEPYSVFASHTDEFLSLLTLNTAFIYSSLTGALEGDSVEEFVSIARKNYPCYDAFVGYLKNDLGIERPTNPASVIENAINNNKNFQVWVDTLKREQKS